MRSACGHPHRLQKGFRSIFEDDALTVTRESTEEDMEAWDSVQNVGDLVDFIGKKRKKWAGDGVVSWPSGISEPLQTMSFTMSQPPSRRKNAGGRPPKYAEPSRPVTVTLPQSVLKGLRRIDQDRGKAIVKLTRDVMSPGGVERPLVEVIEMTAGTGLLLVAESPTLRRIPFLHLVEVAPMRLLLSLEPGHDFRSLELALTDALEAVPVSERAERELVGQVLAQIRRARQEERASMAGILMVSLGEKKGRRKSGDGGTAGKGQKE